MVDHREDIHTVRLDIHEYERNRDLRYALAALGGAIVSHHAPRWMAYLFAALTGWFASGAFRSHRKSAAETWGEE